MKNVKMLLVSGLSFFAAASSYANLQFTVDEFTTDRLTITLLPSEVKFIDSGSESSSRWLTFFGYDDQGRFGSTFVPTGSWIIEGVSQTVQETSPGAIGSAAFDPVRSLVQFSTFAGPAVAISTGDIDYVDGATIEAPYQISFFAAGLFDPSAISGLGLFAGSSNEFDLQSTVNTAPIPEPASYVAILGAVALAATSLRRPRKRRECA